MDINIEILYSTFIYEQILIKSSMNAFKKMQIFIKWSMTSKVKKVTKGHLKISKSSCETWKNQHYWRSFKDDMKNRNNKFQLFIAKLTDIKRHIYNKISII